MYKTIIAIALIATVALAGAPADVFFPNDQVDYVLRGRNGRPMGISMVQPQEYLQTPEQEYVIPFEEEEYLTPT